MKRSIGAFVAGLLAWVVVVSIINRGLRFVISGYAVAESQIHFTLEMMLARLGMAAVTSLIAGALVGRLTVSARVPWVLGAAIMLAFLPVHFQLWQKFPAWYHLAFLLPLAPLIVLGAQLGRRLAHRGGEA